MTACAADRTVSQYYHHLTVVAMDPSYLINSSPRWKKMSPALLFLLRCTTKVIYLYHDYFISNYHFSLHVVHYWLWREGWMTTHSWRTHLSGISSPRRNIALTRSPRLLEHEGEGGWARGENSIINMATDKESEWMQPTWTLQPRSPYLPFPFFPSFPSAYTAPFGIANQPMCFFTGEVGDKEQGVGHISNLSMLFISIYLFYSWHTYLLLCHCLNVCFLAYVHTNVTFSCKGDKDG